MRLVAHLTVLDIHEECEDALFHKLLEIARDRPACVCFHEFELFPMHWIDTSSTLMFRCRHSTCRSLDYPEITASVGVLRFYMRGLQSTGTSSTSHYIRRLKNRVARRRSKGLQQLEKLN